MFLKECVCGRKYGDNYVWDYTAELSPVLLGVGVCKLPITVTTGPTGKVEGRWSDLHTWDEPRDEIRVQQYQRFKIHPKHIKAAQQAEI